MKTLRIVSVLALSLAVMGVAGCKKEPAPSATEQQEPTGVTKDIVAATEKAAESMAAAVGFDAGKSLDQVKAEVAKMDVKQLTAAATACKDAFVAKQLDLAKITEQLKNIPMAEKMGAEAQKLTGEAKTIQEALANIQAQLAVYVGKLKELGADTSALQVK